MVSLVLLAGGKGERFGYEHPKQFYKVNGLHIMEITLKQLNKLEFIDNYVIVTRKGYEDITKEIIEKTIEDKNYVITYGGKTRNESIYNGFKKVKNGEKVFVHDSVRPIIHREIFEQLLEKSDKYDVVTTVEHITGNLVMIEGDKIIDILNREKFVMGTAPVIYNYHVVKDYLRDKDIIVNLQHDIQYPLLKGYTLGYVYNDKYNIKITYPGDVILLENILKSISEIIKK